MSKLIFCWKLPPKKFTLWPVYVTPCKIHFKLDDVLDNLHQRLGKRNFPIASSAWIEKVPRQVSTNWTSRAARGPTNQQKQQQHHYHVEENAIWLKWEKYWKSKFHPFNPRPSVALSSRQSGHHLQGKMKWRNNLSKQIAEVALC